LRILLDRKVVVILHYTFNEIRLLERTPHEMILKMNEWTMEEEMIDRVALTPLIRILKALSSQNPSTAQSCMK